MLTWLDEGVRDAILPMNESEEVSVAAQVSGTLISVTERGGHVLKGQVIAIVESMKMESPVVAPCDGVIVDVMISSGEQVEQDQILVVIKSKTQGVVVARPSDDDLEVVDPKVTELRLRVQKLKDEARPLALTKRRAQGLRTARENLDDLLDPGSYVEYGRFAYAAQSQRRTVEELIDTTPGDGLIAGIGTVGAGQFGLENSACAVLSYDYTVLAGTQGQRGHQKKDRLFDVIERMKLPVIFFTEGGGGRPGDTDNAVVTGLNTRAFHAFARLSGQVPSIGIVAGRCFAGNAALLGCCNVIIACDGASIGMGGPAMIEGGGLGTFDADEIGPARRHASIGSVDVLVKTEKDAIDVAKKILGIRQGSLPNWNCDPKEKIEECLPDDRRRSYDVRVVLGALFDHESVLELRASFGQSMVTAFARLEGRPVAVLANNPANLAGAIDSDAADKAARFMQLAESWGLPLITLVDTPGCMVGPDSEATGLMRHASRMFLAGAALTVPVLSVILRRGYGLGAQSMCAGSFGVPLITVAWPQAEFGAMGVEGAVRLGFRRELAAIEDPVDREAALKKKIEQSYEQGRALNVAAHLEIDDVIEQSATRSVLVAMLQHAPSRIGTQESRRFVDGW